ncbi:hypothetical protein GR160_08690 [Flavobacterium sp. Sd200]|uniref:hypothetical protein n=1 Tax=Flavobacterium sp. Sd200 TaxID=2692211 RepID=UPI00136BF6EC|nr:hypothetical protein [Flavobacterium sp. Sd200]MXN91304.1 hypothetical protein [Flavobacterium sp. Sd200]
MNIISTVNDKRFSINNIRYLKNYITSINGNKIEIFNCYERHDVLVPLTHYSNFMVDGVIYPNVAGLQSALLPVLYSRSNLGGDSPDIDPDNIDVVRHIRAASTNKTDVVAVINNLEMFGIDDKQSLWFWVLIPGDENIDGRIGHPVLCKYKMINYGKGTYGLGAFQLEADDIELISTSKVTVDDIESDPDTDVINYGSLTTQSISNWLRAQNPAINIQAPAQGYTLFKGSVNGVETTYLWLGGTGMSNELTVGQVYFMTMDKLVVAGNQDNIDIKKDFSLASRVYDQATVLNLINSLPAYVVNENQSVWFVGRHSGRIPGFPGIPGSGFITNPFIVKYKMLNKGKGIYGTGHTQLTTNDIELVYSNEASLNDLESVTTTEIIPFTLAEEQTISEWLNTQLSPFTIRPQEDGYTIFKSQIADDELSYLWIGYDGEYGYGESQSSMDDFQLLNETVLPVNQDNVDIKKSFTIPETYTTASILDIINDLESYEIQETQSVWFVGMQRRRPGGLWGISLNFNPVILKYKLLNKGKGMYGRGGIQLLSRDIELVYSNEATVNDMELDVETQVVNADPNTDQSISEWLNEQIPAIVLRPQEEGYTIFKDGSGEEERSWLWIGYDGTYGDGEIQSSDADFQILNKVPTVPATLHRPVKIINTASTGFDSGTYTLLAEDRDMWLVFEIQTDFFVKIPTNVFTANTLLEGENADTGQATFITDGNDLILHHGASELPKTAEMNSVFGLKFRTVNDVSLFGKLEMI